MGRDKSKEKLHTTTKTILVCGKISIKKSSVKFIEKAKIKTTTTKTNVIWINYHFICLLLAWKNFEIHVTKNLNGN